MRTLPLNFIAPMALALIQNRKSQYRRQIIPQPPSGGLGNRPSRYRVDDLIWVQERFLVRNGGPVESIARPSDCLFHADYDMRRATQIEWQCATSLPRAGSRLTLRLDDIDVVRLHAITDEDAIREGVVLERTSLLLPPTYAMPGTDIREQTGREAYAALWNHLHSGDAWDANPLVYRCSFSTYHANVDDLIGA